jgi:hypothetical protein
MGEGGSHADAAGGAEPVSSQVCVPKTTTAEVTKLPSTEMAVGETATAKVAAAEMLSAEMAAAETPAAEVHASEMAASEAAEMTKAAEMTAAETAEMTAAEMAAAEPPEMTAAESTMPKGKSFAHHPRHCARRERGSRPNPSVIAAARIFVVRRVMAVSFPPRNYDPLSIAQTANAWTVPRVPWNFKYGLSLYKRKEAATKRARTCKRFMLLRPASRVTRNVFALFRITVLPENVHATPVTSNSFRCTPC